MSRCKGWARKGGGARQAMGRDLKETLPLNGEYLKPDRSEC